MSVFVCTSEDRLVALERVDGSWTARAALEGLGAQCVATDSTCPVRTDNIDKIKTMVAQAGPQS